jgi:hypothetical protein
MSLPVTAVLTVGAGDLERWLPTLADARRATPAVPVLVAGPPGPGVQVPAPPSHARGLALGAAAVSTPWLMWLRGGERLRPERLALQWAAAAGAAGAAACIAVPGRPAASTRPGSAELTDPRLIPGSLLVQRALLVEAAALAPEAPAEAALVLAAERGALVAISAAVVQPAPPTDDLALRETEQAEQVLAVLALMRHTRRLPEPPPPGLLPSRLLAAVDAWTRTRAALYHAGGRPTWTRSA